MSYRCFVLQLLFPLFHASCVASSRNYTYFLAVARRHTLARLACDKDIYKDVDSHEPHEIPIRLRNFYGIWLRNFYKCCVVGLRFCVTDNCSVTW